MNGNSGAPHTGEIWHQLAEVVTPDWQKLNKDEQIKVALSDCHGAFSWETQMSKEDFQKIFFPWENIFFIKLILLQDFNQEERAFGVSFLNAQKKEIGKHIKLGLRIIEENFQHLLE